ncbi:hypothetical protein ACFZAU_40060 [Streptomyces sp. NPDC008238]
MTYEISEAQIAAFCAQNSAVIEAYLESKEWRRNREGGPRNIWYRKEVAWNLCPSCDDPEGPINDDPYCLEHDDATWSLAWPCGAGAAARDVLHTLCRAEGRGPDEILRALALRDRDEVRVKCGSSLWQELRHPDLGIDLFLALDKVLALASGNGKADHEEGTYSFGDHPHAVELVSENEVLFSFRHAEPPTRDSRPTASRRAAQDLFSAAYALAHPSDRRTHVARRYATGEWTTVEVMGPEDFPPPTPLEVQVGSLFHRFNLIAWTLDRALTSQHSNCSSRTA